ncbi:MAG: DEAD/DEAH box helicase [Candidatus Shapirobacteria bacterium]|nr:DEAD/DEAH box helicase [Candidatus Shapirobacteria bacterium]
MYNNSGSRRSTSGYSARPNYRKFQNRFPKKRSFGKYIDPSLFIKKAADFIKIEEEITKYNFEDFKLDPILLANVKAKGYIKPTPIQDQAILQIMNGKDVLGIANTGTGKTASYAIPLIQKILENPNKRIIILAPTRELATQIKQDIRSFTPGLRVFIALAIGGAFIREQIMDIRRGPNILIGTPGRITDLGHRRVIDFTKFDTVVLDEVDRMLDMGFVDDIKTIVDQIPASRQTLFFSATVDRKIEVLINTFLRDPVKVSVKTTDASDHVEQNVVNVSRHEKEEKLCELLSKKEEFKKVLIFGATKMMVERLTVSLIRQGFNADSIHGDKPQHKRQTVLKLFKEDRLNILVATDVAARGLDIPDVSHVINYDQPNNYEDYCHRIGRTGRGNSKGYALTFVENRY